MAEILRKPVYLSKISRLVVDYVIGGLPIPEGTVITQYTVGDLRLAIEHIVLGNPWIQKQFKLEREEKQSNETEIFMSRSTLPRTKRNVYERFVNIFNDFVSLCDELNKQQNPTKEQSGPN